uniref:Uncharacterized protein n=1 Tax=Brassica campestris TaxID=3711 RepID=M4F2J2_BRACM
MIKWRCCPELVQFHGFSRSSEDLILRREVRRTVQKLKKIMSEFRSLLGIVVSSMPTAGAKPSHARHVLGCTSGFSPSYSAGSRKPLICWIGKTQIDGAMAYVLRLHDGVMWQRPEGLWSVMQ